MPCLLQEDEELEAEMGVALESSTPKHPLEQALQLLEHSVAMSAAQALTQEIGEQKVFGLVLPSVFLGVAVFLLNVVLTRQIGTQRGQIAALKALGCPDWRIGLHYLQYVLVIVLRRRQPERERAGKPECIQVQRPQQLVRHATGADLCRNVTIDDVGNAAAFLLSDLAAGITGEVTYVDSGFSKIVGGMGGEDHAA